MNFTWIVTKCEKSRFMDRYFVELNNGLVKENCKNKPDYKVGDTIASLPHFYDHLRKMNHQQ